MLHILDETGGNIIATKATGELRAIDIEKVHPLVHGIVDKGLKVRWYIDIEEMEGVETEALWEDLKMDVAHFNDYEMIAVVGDKKWEETLTKAMKPFTSAEIRFFEPDEKQKAKDWINAN